MSAQAPDAGQSRRTASVGELLDLDALAPDGTALTSRGELVRVLAVSTANPATLGAQQLDRLANAFGALVNVLAAGERLSFIVEAAPIHIDRLLARSRAQTDATAAAIERAGADGPERARALRRLAAAHEDSIAQHARRDAARELTAYVVVPLSPRAAAAATAATRPSRPTRTPRRSTRPPPPRARPRRASTPRSWPASRSTDTRCSSCSGGA